MGMPEDLRQLLITSGYTTPVFIADAPEKPDVCLVITATGGLSPVRTFNPSPATAPLVQMRAQLRARALTYGACDAIMTAAYAILSGFQQQTINGIVYGYGRAVQTPYYLGLDGASRPVIAVNFDVWRPET